MIYISFLFRCVRVCVCVCVCVGAEDIPEKTEEAFQMQ